MKPDKAAFSSPGFGNKAQFQTLVDLLASSASTSPVEHFPHELGLQMRQLCFQFALARSLQQGPNVTATAPQHPARLLAWAQAASKTGKLPPDTAGNMLQQLTEAEKSLRDAGLWPPNQPLWWEPLAKADKTTQAWQHLLQWCDAFSFGQPRTMGFWHASKVLPDHFLAQLHQTLEASYALRHLGLQRAGVGTDAVVGAHRHDEVRYLNGLESDLLPDNTMLALLVIWAKNHLGRKIPKLLDWHDLVAPQQAMLARYPSSGPGYRAHIDNPGGQEDNGRALTMICYLNPHSHLPKGGELHLWSAGSDPGEEPQHIIKPRGGDIVCFDARTWLHEVTPIEEGPPRWALSLWLNDHHPPSFMPMPPRPSATEMFLGIGKAPLPAKSIVCHHLEQAPISGTMRVYQASNHQKRVGIVCTTYRGGSFLEKWCDHHISLGATHLILVFDHLGDPKEKASADLLIQRFGARNLTCLDGESLLKEGWPNAEPFPDRKALEKVAQSSGHSWSVAARQALNASHVLMLAKGDSFGGHPLDWLLHLDGDELFFLDGHQRGGATLQQHFALASSQNWQRIRYLNHELLAPWTPDQSAIFKINPRLGTARLGQRGWTALCTQLKMAQTHERPYFCGYHNGKSAVAVASGHAAAGVHGWYLTEPATNPTPTFAGPSILHFHCPNKAAFVAKYRSKAAGAPPDGHRPFLVSPLEQAAMTALATAQERCLDPNALNEELAALFERRTHFSKDEAALLKAASLLITPDLKI